MIALLSFNSIGVLSAQNVKDRVCLDNTQQFSIASKYVAGENYIIQVGLPVNYSASQKSYPVLYVTDGDLGFGITKGIADALAILSKEIKDIIVIGITYGQGTDIWMKKRARDYTPGEDTIVAKNWFPTYDGADNFLKFIQNELFPVVNNNYRTNPDSSAIMGISFGGLLSSYILFKQPDLFKGYIIADPSLFWNSKSILKLENEYFRNHKELNCTVYMTYGSLDNKELIIDPTNELIKMIQMHNYQGLKLVTRVFEGETHVSVYSTAITNGMKTLFKP
jgi:predicted alpha/beta superfamily hydrolase